VTRGAITQAISSGRVVVEADGTIDPEADSTKTYLATAKAQRRRGGARAPKEPVIPPPVPAPSPAATVPTSERPPPSEPHEPPDPFGALGPLGGQRPLSSWKRDEEGGESFNAAERRKKIADADMAEIKAAERRGELVDWPEMDAALNQCWAVISSQVLTIAQQISPELGAIFGVDDPGKVTAAQERLDLEIRSALDHFKATMAKYVDQKVAEHA
jgi:hypothetical protein